MSGPEWGRQGGHDDDSRFRALADLYRDAIHREYSRGVERGYRGTMWRPKKDGFQANHVPMSFSRSLLDVAGGLVGLEENWEVEPDSSPVERENV
jgi:hypothetical protein